jgi:magnesium chelatase family protein
LDRIDIHVGVARIEYRELSAKEPAEPSATVRARVVAARRRRSLMQAAGGEPGLTAEAEALLARAALHMALSGRAMKRVAAVARTIAHLSASDEVGPGHLAEALGYRRPDELAL